MIFLLSESDSELRDELMTLLVAGHETTATALTWALYWIHKLPMVREELLNELQTLDIPLDPSVLFRLPYLNAVCSETLRICPVGMLTFAQVARSRVELMGSVLEPGTVVVGCIYWLAGAPGFVAGSGADSSTSRSTSRIDENALNDVLTEI